MKPLIIIFMELIISKGYWWRRTKRIIKKGCNKTCKLEIVLSALKVMNKVLKQSIWGRENLINFSEEIGSFQNKGELREGSVWEARQSPPG